MRNMPIGISDFKKVIEGNYYWVDKSLFLKELIDLTPEVLLFARPRRFGKTILLRMVQYYFDQIDAAKNQALFTGLLIADCGEKYRAAQGSCPVVFLSLKDVKFQDWNSTPP